MAVESSIKKVFRKRSKMDISAEVSAKPQQHGHYIFIDGCFIYPITRSRRKHHESRGF
jgi:hypothetical protein